MRAWFAIGFVLVTLGSAQAQTVQRIEIVESGIFTAHQDRKVEAPGTAVCTTNIVSDVQLVQETATIPARIGVRFGFRYRVVGKGRGTVTLTKVNRLPAPGLRNPDTGNVTITERTTIEAAIGETRYTGYSFDHDWEFVPGTWTFELWQGDRKLTSRSFDVVKP